MTTWRRFTADLPRPMRYWLGGALIGGAVGAFVGLVVGLTAHPATAWFAALEIGGPAGIVSAMVGLCVVFPAVRVTEWSNARSVAARD